MANEVSLDDVRHLTEQHYQSFLQARLAGAKALARLGAGRLGRQSRRPKPLTRRDRARLKLILRGKRFGFSLEEIRQLLNLYDRGDQQEAQLRETFRIATERLAQMERQRGELDEAIAELKEQLAWGSEVIASFRARPAAE